MIELSDIRLHPPGRPDGDDWRPITDGPRDGSMVRLYWPRVLVDDDGELTAMELPELGATGEGAWRGEWPRLRPSEADLADPECLLDWAYGPPTFWKPSP